MPITSVTSDTETLTLTVIGEYPVPVQRLWDAWADPRQLEKFWGPETWPATFTRHDMKVGGRSEYQMTGPDGSTSRGWWRFVAIDPVERIARARDLLARLERLWSARFARLDRVLTHPNPQR